MQQTNLNNNTTEHRYELTNEGKIVGFAEYKLDDNAVVFTHTEIAPEHEGNGYGSQLAKQALEDVRKQGKLAVPRCEFIAAYIERHKEYADLVKQ